MQEPASLHERRPGDAGPAFAVHYVSGVANLAAAQPAGRSPNVLGVIGYGAPRPDCLPAAVPYVAAPLASADGAPAFELWTAASNCQPHHLGEVAGACGGDLAFAAITLQESAGVPLELEVERAYMKLFDFMDETGFITPIRFWNYLTAIVDDTGGLERYRRFNIGRHKAFAARLRQPLPPAASGVGGLYGASVIYVLAARAPAAPIENPRQLSAYRYPKIYGPRSPSFSRASMIVQRNTEALFISGTASIVGHETRHGGDLPGQIAETAANLRALIAAAAPTAEITAPRPGAGDWAVKIYLQNPRFQAPVRLAVDAIFGIGAKRLYLHGEICRPGLLLEIEAFHSAVDRNAPSLRLRSRG